MTDSETRRREYTILLAIIVTMLANQSAIVIISPLAVAIAEEFETTVSLSGQLRTVAAIISGGLAPFVGLMSDRFGRRPIMLLGLLSITTFGLASSVAPTFGLLMLVQAIAGFGVASLLSSGYAMVGDVFPAERRAWAVGVISIGQPMAWMVGLPIIGIVADSFGWRWSFIAVPVIFSLIAMLFLRFIPPSGRQRNDQEGQSQVAASLLAVLRHPPARSWILAELIAYSGWAGTLVFLGAYYITVHGVSTATSSFLLAASAMAFAAGSLMSHRVSGRAGMPWTVVAGAALSAVALMLSMLLSAGLVVSFILLVLFGLMQGVRGASASALGLMQAPEHQGTMMGFRASVVQLGYVLGSIAGGALLALGGYELLGVAFGLVIVAAALFMSYGVGRTGQSVQ